MLLYTDSNYYKSNTIQSNQVKIKNTNDILSITFYHVWNDTLKHWTEYNIQTAMSAEEFKTILVKNNTCNFHNLNQHIYEQFDVDNIKKEIVTYTNAICIRDITIGHRKKIDYFVDTKDQNINRTEKSYTFTISKKQFSSINW